jgi:HemY protein
VPEPPAALERPETATPVAAVAEPAAPLAPVEPLRKAQKPAARPAPVEAVIPLVHAPDDPGPDSGLDGELVPETTAVGTAGPWQRLKQWFR